MQLRKLDALCTHYNLFARHCSIGETSIFVRLEVFESVVKKCVDLKIFINETIKYTIVAFKQFIVNIHILDIYSE